MLSYLSNTLFVSLSGSDDARDLSCHSRIRSVNVKVVRAENSSESSCCFSFVKNGVSVDFVTLRLPSVSCVGFSLRGFISQPCIMLF